MPPTLGTIGHQLQDIYLGNTWLTGAVPAISPSLYNLTGLPSFYLNENALTGGVSSLVSYRRELTNLDVSANKLTGRLAPLPRRLGLLDVRENAFTGEIPTSFENLKLLYHLWLRGNEITGEIPVGFASRLRNLVSLALSGNELRGPVPQGKPFSELPATAFAGPSAPCLQALNYFV